MTAKCRWVDPPAGLGHVAALGLVAALALTACARPTPVPSQRPPAETTPPASAPATQPASGPAVLESITLGLDPVARGLEQPVFVTDAGDGSGRLFVVEQPGRIRVLRDNKLQPGPYLDVSSRISTGGERGLLGLAFAPDFEKSGAFYLDYTDTNGDTVIARFVADDPASDIPKTSGPTTVLKIAQPYSNHNGGCIVFGPDGRLWIGMGDGGSAGDPKANGQNPRALLAKMLALDVKTAGAKPQVMQLGVRNPWRFSFDRETGDLWIGDVGQNAWEEIDFIAAQAAQGGSPENLGWNLWEGTHPYPPGATRSKTGFTFPIAEYSHDEGRSVTGGYVYRGSEQPTLVGTYLYADFEDGWVAGIQRFAPDGSPLLQPAQRKLLKNAGNPSSFGEDDEGELYLTDYGGTLYHVTAQ